jgi:hypothetical protein
MKSTERIGRPFVIDRKISRAIKETTIVYPDGTRHKSSDSGLVPPPKDLLNGDQLKLQIEVDVDGLVLGLNVQEIDAKAVAVSVLASVGKLRRAEEIFRILVPDITNDLIEIDLSKVPTWVVEAALVSRLNLTTYLCLVETIPALDLQPSLQSTWMGRSKLEIGVADQGYAVVIQPLTDDQYKLGVPRGAYSYLEMKGNLAEVTAAQFEITIYLDSEVFGALKQYESSLSSMNSQAKLESAITSGMLRRVVDDCKKAEFSGEDWEALASADPKPVAVNIVTGFAKRADVEASRFFQLLIDETEIALSYVGKVLKLVKQDLELLKPVIGDES